MASVDKMFVQMVDFYLAILKKRFNSDDVLAEWSYNIYEACRRFKEESTDCKIFLSVLHGTMNEEVYVELRHVLERVRTWFERLAAASQSSILQEEFSNTNEEDFVTPTFIAKLFLVSEMGKEEFASILHPPAIIKDPNATAGNGAGAAPTTTVVTLAPSPATQEPGQTGPASASTNASTNIPAPAPVTITVDLKSKEWRKLLESLKEGLERDQNGKFIQYRTLFDFEGESRFLELVKRHVLGQLLFVPPPVPAVNGSK